MKKVFPILFVFYISLFCYKFNVLANYSGTGGIETGSGGLALDEGGWNDTKFGVFIAVFNSNNAQEGDVITVAESTIGNSWIVENSDNTYTATPSVLYDYLDIPYGSTTGDYSNLKWLIRNIKLKKGYYVLIEPYTEIGGVKFTFRGIISKSDLAYGHPFHEWYRVPAMLLSGAATVGSDITVGGNTYKAPSGKCNDSGYGSSTSKKFCGYSNNNFIGYGITVVKYEDFAESYTLTINKTDAETGNGLFGVVFSLSGNGETGSCTTNANGVCSIDGIPANSNEYTLTETLIGGYSASQTSCTGCESANGTVFKVKVESDKTINIINGKTCDSEFNALSDKTNRIERVKLFKKYGYTNLLNFNKVDDVCTYNTACSNDTKIGCLSANSATKNFTKDNLSCYKDTETINGMTAFCGYSFRIKNNLEDSSYSFTNIYTFSTVTTGQMFLKRNNLNIAESTITKTCYLYNINQTTINEEPSDLMYENYVNSLNFNNLELGKSVDDGQWEKTNSEDNTLATFTKTMKAVYKLPRVYAHKGTGKIEYDISGTGSNKYTYLGYGFASKLNETYDENGNYVNVPFSFELSNGDIYDGVAGTKEVSSGTCRYDFKEEIVDKNGKLNFNFRIIDTNNPFPGILGAGRNTGSNWCDDGDCSSKNNLVKNVIINKIDSNYKCSAKYTIELTSSDIQAIRKYNNETTYDDYNLDCDSNGRNCKSSFLQMLEIGELIFKNSSSESISNLIINEDMPSSKTEIFDTACQYSNMPDEDENEDESTTDESDEGYDDGETTNQNSNQSNNDYNEGYEDGYCMYDNRNLSDRYNNGYEEGWHAGKGGGGIDPEVDAQFDYNNGGYNYNYEFDCYKDEYFEAFYGSPTPPITDDYNEYYQKGFDDGYLGENNLNNEWSEIKKTGYAKGLGDGLAQNQGESDGMGGITYQGAQYSGTQRKHYDEGYYYGKGIRDYCKGEIDEKSSKINKHYKDGINAGEEFADCSFIEDNSSNSSNSCLNDESYSWGYDQGLHDGNYDASSSTNSYNPDEIEDYCYTQGYIKGYSEGQVIGQGNKLEYDAGKEAGWHDGYNDRTRKENFNNEFYQMGYEEGYGEGEGDRFLYNMGYDDACTNYKDETFYLEYEYYRKGYDKGEDSDSCSATSDEDNDWDDPYYAEVENWGYIDGFCEFSVGKNNIGDNFDDYAYTYYLGYETGKIAIQNYRDGYYDGFHNPIYRYDDGSPAPDKYYEGYMAGIEARWDYDRKCQDDDNRNWCDDHWISYPDENEIDPPDWDGICAQ